MAKETVLKMWQVSSYVFGVFIEQFGRSKVVVVQRLI